MDQGIALVAAAALGSVLSLLGTELFKYFHAKNEREERFSMRYIQNEWSFMKKS
jgi:hypothetical protein